MIHNEGSEEEIDWWENGKKKKTKESIFYHIYSLTVKLYITDWLKVMFGKK